MDVYNVCSLFRFAGCFEFGYCLVDCARFDLFDVGLLVLLTFCGDCGLICLLVSVLRFCFVVFTLGFWFNLVVVFVFVFLSWGFSVLISCCFGFNGVYV